MKDIQLHPGDVIIDQSDARYLVTKGIGFFVGLLRIRDMQIVLPSCDYQELLIAFYEQVGDIKEVVPAQRVHVEVDNHLFGD